MSPPGWLELVSLLSSPSHPKKVKMGMISTPAQLPTTPRHHNGQNRPKPLGSIGSSLGPPSDGGMPELDMVISNNRNGNM